jgi:uncharacterized protein
MKAIPITLPACLRLWLGLCALLLAAVVHAQAVQPVPELAARVTAGQVQRIEGEIRQLEQDKGSQIAVLMVGTTAPEDIFSYSNRVANAWKIGRADVGDGLLVVVAKDDRRMRIEVAKTLEGAVTDIQAGRIVGDVMAPRFKQGDFAGGIEGAVQALAALVRGEALPAPEDDVLRLADQAGQSQGPWHRALVAMSLSMSASLWIGVLWFAFAPRAWSGWRKLGWFVLANGVFVALVGWSVWSPLLGLAGMLLAIPSGSLCWGAVGFFRAVGGGQWVSGGGSGGGSSSSWSSGSSGSGGGSSSRSSSSSSSSSYSSGGGGSFGGGGASGSW